MVYKIKRKRREFKKKPNYKVEGEVYNVRDYYEEFGIPTKNIKPDWYEYRVRLVDKKTGRLIHEWDSKIETYNIGQELSKKEAENSLKEIITDVKKGKASYWFNIPEEKLNGI